MKLFWRKKKQQQEVKAQPPAMQYIQQQSLIEALLTEKHYDLAAYMAICYYSMTAPIGIGIRKIAKNGGSINPLIYNENKEQYAEFEPLEELLDDPNMIDKSWNEFIQKYISFLLITGNNYMIANFVDLNQEPKTLSILPPQMVNPKVINGDIAYYQVASATGSPIEYQKQIIKSKILYVATLSNGIKSVMLHSRFLNPNLNNYDVLGQSPLTPIYYEIEQYLAASIHNLSVLKRGATLCGIFKTPGLLTSDQRDRLIQQINDQFSGESNSGKAFLAEGGLDYQTAQQTNKDMEFMQLKLKDEEMVYKALMIPLALMTTSVMTMSNLETAKLDLYDEAVLPIIDRNYADLTKFLMPFYKNTDDLIISYDQNKISALEPRRMQTMKDLVGLGVLTINELRAKLNYESLDSGGDAIYAPANDIPIAIDINTSNPQKDISRQMFEKILKNHYGKFFDQEEINSIADRAYG